MGTVSLAAVHRIADPPVPVLSTTRRNLARAGARLARDRVYVTYKSGVAFPSISTGAYGYPLAEAAAVSVQALCGAVTAVQSVLLVAFSPRVQELWERALDGGPASNGAVDRSRPR